MSTPAKPVKLELNNSGAWKLLGTFDADDEQADAVLLAADALLRALAWNTPAEKIRATLRVSTAVPGDTVTSTLLHWTGANGWRTRQGEPA